MYQKKKLLYQNKTNILPSVGARLLSVNISGVFVTAQKYAGSMTKIWLAVLRNSK